MKGALAIIMELFKELHRRHQSLPLGLAVTSDEELGGERGIGFLFDEIGLRCTLALIPDGGSLTEVPIEEKGILHLRFLCEGRSAHAARPWLGDNPLEKLLRNLGALKDRFEGLGRPDQEHWCPTCALTILKTANATVNRIPFDAEAVVDIRFPSPYTADDMLQAARSAVDESIRVEVIIADQPTHFSPDRDFIKLMEEFTGRKVAQVHESGGSDARFIRRHKIPVIIARPEVGNVHAKDEWIDIQSMVTFYQICERFIEQRLTSRAGN
jgi:succinyl-diaminopimelate desuccinylase